MSGKGGKAAGPVYARLIQPPGQIRLATVRTAAPGGGSTAVRLAGPASVCRAERYSSTEGADARGGANYYHNGPQRAGRRSCAGYQYFVRSK